MVTAPTYGKWCDRKLWTLHESICLMLAIEPDTRSLKDAHDVGGMDPLLAAIEQYAELAAEAMKRGILKPFSSEDLGRPLLDRRINPREFLEWAQSRSMAIPDELRPLLARDPAQRLAEGIAGAELSARHYSRRSADRYPDAREQILGAALAALKSYPDRCRDLAGICRAIAENAPLIWPETRQPPLPVAEMERLIGRWLDRLG